METVLLDRFLSAFPSSLDVRYWEGIANIQQVFTYYKVKTTTTHCKYTNTQMLSYLCMSDNYISDCMVIICIA